MTVYYHGSSLDLKDTILRDGLREPVAGRGIWVSAARSVSIAMACRNYSAPRCLVVTLAIPETAPLRYSDGGEERHLRLAHVPVDWIVSVEVGSSKYFAAAEVYRQQEIERAERTALRRRKCQVGSDDWFAIHIDDALADDITARDLVAEAWQSQHDRLSGIVTLLEAGDGDTATAAARRELERCEHALSLLEAAARRDFIEDPYNSENFKGVDDWRQQRRAVEQQIEAGVQAIPDSLLPAVGGQPVDPLAIVVSTLIQRVRLLAAPSALNHRCMAGSTGCAYWQRPTTC
jgi:hypothetical protein